MKGLPIYVVERAGGRVNVEFNDLTKEDSFWTVDCQLVDSAEQLVKEAKSDATVWNLVEALGDSAQKLPNGTIVYNLDVSPVLRDSVEAEFEPELIVASESLRRVDIRWVARAPRRWVRVDDLLRQALDRQASAREARVAQYLEQRLRRQDIRRPGGVVSTSLDHVRKLWLGSPEVSFQGADEYSGVASHLRTFLRGDIQITKFLRTLAVDKGDQNIVPRVLVFSWIFLAACDLGQEQAVNFASANLRHVAADLGEDYTRGREDFIEAMRLSPLQRFNTWVWKNRSFGADDF
jgi:hypothetical protein